MPSASDQNIRTKALDITQSFIVQAPAGSGKTELLTQRYLALLASVDASPEEIIAITFTRKATAEMRNRIIESLNLALKPEPTEPHKKTTWKLAQQALQHDKKHQWDLLDNPNRLRILTLDGLASYLCKQLPVLSQSIANLDITADPSLLYQKSIHECIEFCINHKTLAKKLQVVLLHLDNKPQQLQQLLIQLLYKREQWLPHILPYQDDSGTLKKHLESALNAINSDALSTLDQAIAPEIKTQLFKHVSTAADTLKNDDPTHPIGEILNYDHLPNGSIDSKPIWLAIIHCLIKKDGSWRKTVDKRLGFTSKSTLKTEFIALLKNMSDNDTLLSAINHLVLAPPVIFDNQQWHFIEALLAILPILVAHCRVTFHEKQQIDFIELNIAAQQALGTADNPTDIALYLDYKTKHILIDEFQDTSITQFKLLETLLAGWESGDGRSLFLVGDPMQSIYRFREADVSLFLRAQKHGIGPVSLHNLTLTQNFRSHSTIVSWINNCFSQVFPQHADINTAAIPYTAAVSSKQSDEGAINYHPLVDATPEQQAQRIISKIQHYRNIAADESIAILVRSRSHLHAIALLLEQKKINYEAIDITPLASRIEIQELMTLTRALLHRSDHIAWLALLRAPYCGLRLNALFDISNYSTDHTVWHNINHYAIDKNIEHDTKHRLSAIITVLTEAFDQQATQPFYRWLESIWLKLNVAANYTTTQLQNCKTFFECLMDMQSNSVAININTIELQIKNLYAKPEASGDNSIKLMTIHKSKGLEFDHVILPELNRKTINDSSQLLLWHEKLVNNGKRDLLIASIKHVTEDSNPIYKYIATIEQKKSYYESQRLLYVAATRAKKTLDLVFTLSSSENTKSPYKAPLKSSFIGMLWPHYQQQCLQEIITIDNPEQDIHIEQIKFSRYENITHDYTTLRHPNNSKLNYNNVIGIDNDPLPIQGIIIHSILEQLASLNQKQLREFNTANHQMNWKSMITAHGIIEPLNSDILQVINQAVENILNDTKGLWILHNEREHSYSEYAVTVNVQGKIKHYIVDRWFIDTDNTLWIIDYKITDNSNSIEAYKAQLQQYKNALQPIYPNNAIRTAIYMPLTKTWTELELEKAAI